MIPTTIRKNFFDVISDTENNINLYVNNPGSDMTRHRKCNFQDTVLCILNFSMARTNTELKTYFGIGRDLPSMSAFTQQRHKFNSLLFPHLLKGFNEAVPFKKTYKGYHLVAADGSDINLPTDKNDTVYRVKQANSDDFYYQAHINAFYDICEERYISAFIQPRPEMNENAAFCSLVTESNLPDNTIFIADRGYAAINTVAHLIENHKYFIIRAKSPSSSGSFTRNLMEADTESDQTRLIAISRCKKNFRNHSFDKYVLLRKHNKFDLIDQEDKTSVYFLTIRLVCICLGEGNYEYLMTNLPADTFPPAELKELYWRRWSIETSFRRLKYALSLSHLHAYSRDLIKQEIYAKMILYNFTSLLISYAQQSQEMKDYIKMKQCEQKVSFENNVFEVKCFIREKMTNKKIKALLLKHSDKVKEKRVFPRKVRSQRANSLAHRA